MSQNQFPQGGQFPPQGGQFPPQGGQFPPQGGQFPPQGGQFPPQGGQFPQGQGGQFPPQGGQFPPQAGYGAAGFGQQAGYGQPGGYGQAPMGYGGPQPPKKSNVKIIAIVLAAVIVVALVGLVFVFLNKPAATADPTPPVPPTARPQPTTPPQTTGPVETTQAPQPQPQPDPTTNAPQPQPQPGGQGISFGNGLSVTPADGWKVTQQTENSVSFADASGRIFSVNSGQSSDVKADVQSILDQVVQGAGNVRKSDVVTPDAPPGTELAMQGAQVSVSGGGGTVELFAQVAVAARTNDRVAFAAILIIPAEDLKNKAITDQVNFMLNSAYESLMQGV